MIKPVLFVLIPFLLFSQDDMYVNDAKKYVSLLSSEEFKGRGYVQGGHLKAASFIKDEIAGIGLEKISGSRSQEFEVEINALESEPRLSINAVSLRLGLDYVPHELSASGDISSDDILYVEHGLYIPMAGINQYQQSPRGKIVIIDNDLPKEIKKNKQTGRYASEITRIKIARQLGARAVILLQDRLTFGAPYTRLDIPVFRVKKSSLPRPLKNIELEIETDIDDYDTQNVFGLLKGHAVPDSIIMLTAHYDHLGALGDSIYFPGANDNASGVALVLSLAKYFKRNPSKYSLLFVFFSGEEAGLVGSKYFQEHPRISLDKVKFLINFDMAASAENGIMAVGGKDFPAYFNKLKAINDSLAMGKLGRRKNAANSDHYFFIKNGMKGFYLFTKDGKQPYHHINDTYETLEWDDFSHLFKLARIFLREI